MHATVSIARVRFRRPLFVVLLLALFPLGSYASHLTGIPHGGTYRFSAWGRCGPTLYAYSPVQSIECELLVCRSGFWSKRSIFGNGRFSVWH